MTIEPVADGKEFRGYPIDADTMLFHWAPSDRRASITVGGLRIRQRSAHAPVRYPMVCLALDPRLAWEMSGGTFEVPDVQSWDLWGVYAGDIRSGFEVIPNDDLTVREVRVYRAIPARFVHYLASRVTHP